MQLTRRATLRSTLLGLSLTATLGRVSFALADAGSPREAMTLFLTAPEFQRR